MAIALDSNHFADDIDATAQTEITNADNYKRHQFHFDTASGVWSIVIEASPDDGTTWIAVSETLALSSNSGSIFVPGAFPDLRANMTRTSGNMDGWVLQTDAHPLRW